MIRLMTVVAFSAAALVSAAPVFAQTTNESDVRVTLNGDLNDPVRARDAYSRLYAAAQDACWTKGQGPQWRAADDRACEQEAMGEAVAAINNRQLTHIYNQVGVDSNRIARIAEVTTDTQDAR